MEACTRRAALRQTMTVGALATLGKSLIAAESPVVDPQLEAAQTTPQVFMFIEQVTTKADDLSQNLVITSACNVRGQPEEVIVRPGSFRFFRANATLDDVTKQGGWHWRCGGKTGHSRFEKQHDLRPTGMGPLVMVVRQLDGTVHWSLLALDFRC